MVRGKSVPDTVPDTPGAPVERPPARHKIVRDASATSECRLRGPALFITVNCLGKMGIRLKFYGTYILAYLLPRVPEFHLVCHGVTRVTCLVLILFNQSLCRPWVRELKRNLQHSFGNNILGGYR